MTGETINNELDFKWKNLIQILQKHFGKKPDLQAILFLIGIQELGLGNKQYSKEEKQDLINIATCRILAISDHYKLLAKDKDNWPIWELNKKLPNLSLSEQEEYLKWHVIYYFSDIYEI